MAKFTCTMDEYEDHVDSCDGICLACGEWTVGGVEPDASGYACEVCEAEEVMGAEEAALMGHLSLDLD